MSAMGTLRLDSGSSYLFPSCQQWNSKRRFLPEILEALRRQFSIPDSMLDVLMAHVMLNCPGILAIVGQFTTG